ncbi:hypothetical protein HOLleu_32368 [Holothuria leucospilota]|uniref:Uncharacterized protein n=1 Tax=Holothuria leucospilota TaxID=206669 RepID=A0A9Q1BIK6_HOLLE|nr:hypothetical protein HOLleu_32368 [Holothuria leucospilota]
MSGHICTRYAIHVDLACCNSNDPAHNKLPPHFLYHLVMYRILEFKTHTWRRSVICLVHRECALLVATGESLSKYIYIYIIYILYIYI